MKIILIKKEVINLKNYHQKKLEEMNLAHVTQEKNTSIVMDPYKNKIEININKIIEVLI